MWLVGGRPKRYVSTWHTPNLLLLPGAIEGALNGCDPRPYLAWSGLPASAGAPQAATS